MSRPAPMSLPQKVLALARQRLTRLDPSLVVYNSFGGRFSDNPRAIYEELVGRSTSLHHLWTADETPFAGDAETVLLGSTDYLRRIGEAGHVVSNYAMPLYAVKHRATYLQTWHGTPLKRIGYDNPRRQRNKAGFRRAIRDYKQWDYLVSQNAFSTEIFRRAFRYEGEVLETGYPRNDVLNSPQAPEIRRRVRADLGIPDGATVLLYAPTFRDDDAPDASGRFVQSIVLDIARLQQALGDDAYLLLRLHYWVQPSLADLAVDRVRNVSDHPDIRDLYLVADVLATDYSSVMFDFGVTGKPMLFFTYDLDRYRDALRGFYFDLVEQAPGPICRTTDEVIAVMQSLDDAMRPHQASYDQFRATYCALDDGQASRRVVDRVFGPA